MISLHTWIFVVVVGDYSKLTGVGDLWQCLSSEACASSNPEEINNYQMHHLSLSTSPLVGFKRRSEVRNIHLKWRISHPLTPTKPTECLL